MPKQEYKMVNLEDGNESYGLKSTNEKDAALEALEFLGWGICSKELKVKEWVKLLKRYPFRNYKRDRKKVGE